MKRLFTDTQSPFDSAIDLSLETLFEQFKKDNSPSTITSNDENISHELEFYKLVKHSLQRKFRKLNFSIPITKIPIEIWVDNIIGFLEVEFILGGSVFMINRFFYENLYENNVRLWKLLLCQLWRCQVGKILPMEDKIYTVSVEGNCVYL